MKLVRSKLLRAAIIIVSLILIVTLSQSVISTWQKRDVVRQRQAELARVEVENKLLKQKLVETQSSDFIEREAREKLGLARPGESVVLMPTASEAGFPEAKTSNVQPNWRQWWKLFF